MAILSAVLGVSGCLSAGVTGPARPAMFEPGTRPGEYLAHGAKGSLRLTQAGIEFAASGRPIVTLTLPGAQAVAPVADERQTSVSHYYVGKNPEGWRMGVAHYGKVRYRGVYPGIDLVFYQAPAGSGSSFEYDFVVQPGADPGRIRMRFDGAEEIRLNAAGDLVAGDGWLKQHRPRIWQNGREIAGSFRLRRDRTVSFDIGAYDRTLVLMIDPVITYVSYVGGAGEDIANGVAVDAAGNVYVAGVSNAPDFQGTGSFPKRLTLLQFAFVSKFAPIAGGRTQLLYTIYLGDQTEDKPSTATAVTVDSSGNVIVVGRTVATGFPTKNAFQTQRGGEMDCRSDDTFTPVICSDAFLSKFSADGRTMVFSTYYGGKFTGLFNDVAADGAGGIYAAGIQAGNTDRTGTANAFQLSTAGASEDMVVTRWDPEGRLVYATYLGGSGGDNAHSIAVEKPGVVWVGGATNSTDMPMSEVNNGLHTRFTALVTSGYLARLDMNIRGPGALTYATYFNGTTNNTSLAKLFLDPAGQVVFCGATTSNIPVTATRMQNFGGFPVARSTGRDFITGDAYIARINPQVAGLPGLTYSTFVGGNDVDFAASCGLDPKGNLVVTGTTFSNNLFFMAGSPIPYKIATGFDASNVFLIRIDPTQAGGRVDSIQFGGNAIDQARAMAIDAKGFAYIAGFTGSLQFPSTQFALQRAYGGNSAFYKDVGCCGDGFLLQADLTAPQAAAARLVQAAGDFQFSAPGAVLSAPVSVQLADVNGNRQALSGYPITFTATNATVTPALGYTDGTGVSGTNVRLSGAGDATVTATVTGTSLTPYTFRLKALAGTLPTSVAIVSGDRQSGSAGVPLSQPLVVELRDANNAALAMAGFTVQFRANNASVPAVNVVTDASGRASTPVTLGAAADNSSILVVVGGLPVVIASYTITGGRAPSISAGGVASAATFLAGEIAPGLIVTLFGAGIGPAELAVNGVGGDGKFASTLAGTQVLFDGVAAPMIYASAGQTSAIVPYDVAGKATTQVTVVYQGLASAAQTVRVAPTQLGLFSANSSGQGQAAILNQDNSVNSSANPAARNSIVILFGTGEGQTSPAGVNGQTAVSVYPKPLAPIAVRIGGSNAEVLYYGAAPTLVAGVLQVNVKIPPGIPDGNATVQIFAGASASPATVTVAVKGDQ